MTFLSKINIASAIMDLDIKRAFRALLGVETIAAAGSAQTDATALTGTKNVVTAANGTKGVILPVAELDMQVTVTNTVATLVLKVYPATGEQINALGANAAFSLAAGGEAVFHCDAIGHWYVNAMAAVTSTPAELNILDGVTASAAELNYLDITALGTGAASKAVVLDAGDDYTWPAAGVLTYGVLKDPAANTITATGAELNYLDITTLGTGAASKAVVLDSGEDYVWPDTGVLTLGVLAAAVEAAEHGAGAIGTAATPKTRRWIDRGVIVTQTTFDLTGLASVATANDVIGLAAGGAAFIGRNVEATNGVIFKVELSCLETPTTGDNDVNVVANASAALAYDGAGGTTYLSNSGDLLKGQSIQNLVPALTEGDYFYLTAGTGDTAGTYASGMYVLTTYGHPVLA